MGKLYSHIVNRYSLIVIRPSSDHFPYFLHHLSTYKMLTSGRIVVFCWKIFCFVTGYSSV